MNVEIDPDWAWQMYSPDDETPWNLRAVSHLYRRLGFGVTGAELREALEKSPAEAVDELLNAKESESFVRDMQSLADTAVATGNTRQVSSWWVYRILSTDSQALEKLTLFWHGHFATSAEKVTDAALMRNQNELLRQYALGDFSKLLEEISRDPAMLLYLDSATNRKAHPNENYAREIMELFCLGEGNYTEADIRELARCFTGWEIRRSEFRFNRFQHDTGQKQILGQVGHFGGEDGVRIVLEQDSAPEFLAGKLVQYLVMDEPVPNTRLIAPLAREMRDAGMQIKPLVRRIVTSRLFFSPLAVGRKIKSPAELALGLLRSLEASTNVTDLAESMHRLGQGLLYPPSVKGWDGGRTWINSSTLIARSNLVRELITHEKTRFGRASLQSYLDAQGYRTATAVIDHLETLLFAVPLPESARVRIESLMSAGTDQAFKAGLHAMCTLPEFQLG